MITRSEIIERATRNQSPHRSNFRQSTCFSTIDNKFTSINPHIVIDSLLSLASLSLIEKKTRLASDFYRKALKTAQESGTPTLAIQPLLGLSSIALRNKKDNQARDYYRMAVLIAKGLKNKIE